MKNLYKLIAVMVVVKLLTLTSAAVAQTPDINRFIQTLWQQSPVIHEAEAKVESTRSSHKAASKWLYNPEVELEAEDKDGEKKTKIIGISQTIDWNGKFLASGKIGAFKLEKAIAERDLVRQDLGIDVLSALADYQTYRAVMNMATRRTALMQNFSALAKNSFNAGDTDQSEYNLARLALSEALIQNVEAETNLTMAKEKLNSLSGFVVQKEEDFPLLPYNLPALTFTNMEFETLILKLPEIRMLQSKKDAAQAEIKLARRNKLADPTISVRGGKEEGTDLVGISLSIPLNIFNSFQAEVDVARNESLAIDKSIRNALHIAKTKLIAEHRNYSLSASAWNNWRNTGDKALSEQITILDKKLKIGDLSATDYLVQIQQTLNTEIAAIELYNKTWQAWFSWLAASGTIENWLGEIK